MAHMTKKELEILAGTIWYINKLMGEAFFIEFEDIEDIINHLNPLASKYLKITLIKEPVIYEFDELEFLEDIQDTLKLKLSMSNKKVNITLLIRYLIFYRELEYIATYEDIEDLQELSINLMDALQVNSTIKIYDDIAGKCINDYGVLFDLVDTTLKTEIRFIQRGFYNE